MALYEATPGTADPTAFNNSLVALDQAFLQTFGNCIISGLALSSNGEVSAGMALVGHIIKLPAQASALATLLALGSTGTFDLYAVAPIYQENQASNLGVPGTYPDSTGADSLGFKAVPTGTPLPNSQQGALLATAVLAGGAIINVNNDPSGRVNVVTPAAMAAMFAKLQYKCAVIPLDPLTAPLPQPIALVFPFAATLLQVQLQVIVPPVGASIIANCTKNGALECWSASADYPTIAAGATKGQGAIAPDNANSFAASDYLKIDLTQVGSTTPGGILMLTVLFQLQ